MEVVSGGGLCRLMDEVDMEVEVEVEAEVGAGMEG